MAKIIANTDNVYGHTDRFGVRLQAGDIVATTTGAINETVAKAVVLDFTPKMVGIKILTKAGRAKRKLVYGRECVIPVGGTMKRQAILDVESVSQSEASALIQSCMSALMQCETTAEDEADYLALIDEIIHNLPQMRLRWEHEKLIETIKVSG